MKKANKILCFILFCLSMSACQSIKISSLIQEEEIIAAQIKQTKDKKHYVEVDSKPFLYNGVQIRVDWLMNQQKEDLDELEYYFKMASELHVNVVELPLQWKDLEPTQDAYNFRNLSKMLSYAQKYNLKVELLLFTVNIGGMSGCVPNYIKENKTLYPQYENTLNHKDALFFVQDNENLLIREGKMVQALMAAIYDWSKVNRYNPVMSIQVRNEPDLYLKRIKENNVSIDGQLLSEEYAIKETLTAIDFIANIIKESPYKLITRVNVCCFKDHPELNYRYWNDLLSLKSIDMIGEDTYSNDISYNKNILLDMQNRLYRQYNTYAQIAENTGHYLNNPSLILMANLLGASYCLYDLITPQVITDEWKYYDWGILDNKTKEGKETFVPTANLLEGINKVNRYMVLAPAEDIAGFNLSSSNPKEQIKQTIRTTKTTYEFTTDCQAIGYAINYEENLYLYVSNDATLTIYDSELESIGHTGYVDDSGQFIEESEFVLDHNTLSLKGNLLYKLKATKLTNQVSNTIDAIGTEE